MTRHQAPGAGTRMGQEGTAHGLVPGPAPAPEATRAPTALSRGAQRAVGSSRWGRTPVMGRAWAGADSWRRELHGGEVGGFREPQKRGL